MYTPGPLTTSYSVKKAMMKDLGSRDDAFINVIKDVNLGLLDIAKVERKAWTCIPMQGSGTFGVEATLSSVVNKKTGVSFAPRSLYSRCTPIAYRPVM